MEASGPGGSERPGGVERVGAVEYEHVGRDYLEERALTKHAGVWLIMLLGIGYVISGEYFSWNFGFDAGGWGGFLVATVLMAIMYYGLVFAMCEMASALPHSGGPYAFARRALGPWGGFATGLGVTIAYVLATGAISVAIAAYILGLPSPFEDLGKLWFIEPVEWLSLLFFAIFVYANMRGVELVFTIVATVTIIALITLVVWGLVMVFDWDASNFSNIAPGDEGNATRAFPFGISGIWAALPFAAWFYLAIEATPLASEEAKDPKRDLPRGSLYAMTVLLLASGIAFFVGGGAGGAELLSGSANPIPAVVEAVYGKNWFFWVVTVVGLTGLIASFHSIIFAYSRQIFALSRAGYIPRTLSRTGKYHTPTLAIVIPALLVWGIVIVYSRLVDDAEAIANIVQVSVFGALIFYILSMVAFIVLRIREPDLERAYRSPVGIPGAVVTGLLAAVALGSGFNYTTAAQWTIIATIGLILLGLAYFALVTRHRLVAEAPEEEFAVIERAEAELGSDLAAPEPREPAPGAPGAP
jgi:ethanolamine permease